MFCRVVVVVVVVVHGQKFVVCMYFVFFSTYKPIGASPRRNEDGTILVCSTYILYNIIHGSDWYQKRGGTLRGLRIKVVSILILRKPRFSLTLFFTIPPNNLTGNSITVPT